MKPIETRESAELQFYINRFNCKLSVCSDGEPLRLAVIDGAENEVPYNAIDSCVGGAAVDALLDALEPAILAATTTLKGPRTEEDRTSIYGLG